MSVSEEFQRAPSVAVSCTQLGTPYTAVQARRVVDNWIEFFASGPTPIRDLQFTSRTPKRLFDSLHGQSQLRRLTVKWGDYDDLSVLTDLAALRDLHLRGASSVTDVGPLGNLIGLEQLQIEGFKSIHDLSPLARLPAVTGLELGGNWMTPRIAHVDSIAFLRQMTRVEVLLLHTIIVDDLDYSPLLDMPQLRSVRVMKARGMTPSHEYLQSNLPWSA